jgi:cytochrome c5
MANCADCGNRLYSDMCAWCHEELWIEIHQWEDRADPPTKEWVEKIEEQIDKRREIYRSRNERR